MMIMMMTTRMVKMVKMVTCHQSKQNFLGMNTMMVMMRKMTMKEGYGQIEEEEEDDNEEGMVVK